MGNTTFVLLANMQAEYSGMEGEGKTEVILVDLNKLLIKVTRAATEENSA